MTTKQSYLSCCSVLNTDTFDKRRFTEIFKMSTGLQHVCSKSELPMIEYLLADMWAALYKMKPQIIDNDTPITLAVNKSIMEKMMGDEQFEQFRIVTKLDDVSASIGTIAFGKKINHWLDQQQEQNEILQQRLKEAKEVKKQLDTMDEATFDENMQRIENELSKLIGEINDQLQLSLDATGVSASSIPMKALEETKQVKEGLLSLFGGLRAGNGEAQLKKIPLRDQLAVAEKIATDEKMKEIADWAGRFKQIARKKQKTMHRHSVERKGVTFGSDLERLLPLELGLYMHPAAKTDFLRRFAEGQTMEFEQKGREELQKGPIVVCLDQSGSMKKMDTQAKGFTLALLSIAKKQRRDFCLITFSSKVQVKKYEKGKLKGLEVVQLASDFLGGGTDFELPLKKTLDIIKDSRFTKADVIFVTDGEHSAADVFLKKFNQTKSEKEFSVLTLVIGERKKSVEPFSDKIIQIQNFDDTGSFTAFEL